MFDRISSVKGGIELLEAIGFFFYCGETDFMACIPLAADLDTMVKEVESLLLLL